MFNEQKKSLEKKKAAVKKNSPCRATAFRSVAHMSFSTSMTLDGFGVFFVYYLTHIKLVGRLRKKELVSSHYQNPIQHS